MNCDLKRFDEATWSLVPVKSKISQGMKVTRLDDEVEFIKIGERWKKIVIAKVRFERV